MSAKHSPTIAVCPSAPEAGEGNNRETVQCIDCSHFTLPRDGKKVADLGIAGFGVCGIERRPHVGLRSAVWLRDCAGFAKSLEAQRRREWMSKQRGEGK